MTCGSRRTILCATAVSGTWLMGVVLAGGQAGSEQKPPMAEQVFKNVQVLKGIPVDEFMGTMGVFSAALGFSCEDCHATSDKSWDDYAIDTSPKKLTARRMIVMMSSINRTNFGGRQVVTCYTCHRGSDRPKVTPNLGALYGAPPDEPDDIVAQASGAPAADQIVDKYMQAIGGTTRLAALRSFIAKGTRTGYGPEGEKVPVEIYARAPDQRTTVIHTLDGDSTTACDGRAAWISAPHRPVPVLDLTGGDLEGVKLDAQLSFPGQIKQVLGNWRVGLPATVNDRQVQVVQGTTRGETLATLYFDAESGLLVRLVRFADSRVGRLPTQIDYSDYRDVSGVKMPFRWTMIWLDGRDNFELTDVQPNVPIDPPKFGRPAPSKR